MSSRTRFASLFIAIFALAFLVACGSSSNSATAPPTGGFTNANFSGTYVFSFSGTDYTDINNLGDSGYYFAAAGTLTATPGSGTTGGSLSGTIDVVDPQLAAAIGGSTSSVQTGLAATGSYTIGVDGRGAGTLSFSFASNTYQFGLDFVMTSTDHGLITRFDDNGTGSGTIDMQTSGVAQSALAGSYSFALSGVQPIADELSTATPLGTVGTFTLGSTGAITSGLQDFNDGGSSTNLQALSLTGSVNIAATPGTATLATGVSGFPSLTFDVWVISPSQVTLIETDGVEFLEGNAYVSTGQSFPSGSLVYTMDGLDTDGGPLASGGLLTSDGSSTISSGLEDNNDEGNVVEAPSVNGSLSTSNGRTLVTLNGIYNGDIVNSTIETGNYTFAAYPYSYGTGGVGVVLLEIDNGGTTSGTAYLQSSTSVAASQGYGLNLTGSFSTGDDSFAEADMIAEFTTTSTNLTGLYDINYAGATASDLYFGSSSNPGTYSSPSGGRGTASIPLQTNNTATLSALGITYYTVDNATVAFIESDTSGQVTAGSFEEQNASSASTAAAALPHFSMVHPAKGALKAHQNQQKK
jgi:hypothetical protein